MHTLVARQLLRAIRGPRSQLAFSRRLGYRTNVATDWEAGRRMPTAAEMLRAAAVVGLPVDDAIRGFHPASAQAWSGPEALSTWLRSLAGGVSQRELGERSGVSRFRIGRWLRGDAEPRVPEFLALLDALTGRAVDLVSALVPIQDVPCLVAEARRKRLAENLLFAHPWSPALLALMDAHPELHEVDLARALGLRAPEIAPTLDAMRESGLVERESGGWSVRPFTGAVRGSPAERRELRGHWASVSARRVRDPGPGDVFGFNTFAVSRADMDEIRALYRSFYRQVRSIVAASEPSETAGMLVVHIAEWSAE